MVSYHLEESMIHSHTSSLYFHIFQRLRGPWMAQQFQELIYRQCVPHNLKYDYQNTKSITYLNVKDLPMIGLARNES